MSISGFGPVGPDQFAPGLDQVAQGMSGLMSVTGAGEQTPMRVGIPIIDTVSGIYAALGITAALASRGRDGRGHRVQTSLLESAIDLDNVKRTKEESWKRTLCIFGRPRQTDSRWVETPKRPHTLRDSMR